VRHALLIIALSFLAGCAGWKVIERGEWEVVWTKENAARPAEDKVKMLQGYGGFGQEVVSRETYDAELTEGTRRKVEPLAGVRPASLKEVSGKVTLAVGELRSFRIDEKNEPTLTWMGNVVDAWLTEPKRVDGWKGDEAVDGREAMLHLVGTRPGKATFQLVEGTEKWTVEVTVTTKEKK
jgi:hypothetical protein